MINLDVSFAGEYLTGNLLIKNKAYLSPKVGLQRTDLQAYSKTTRKRRKNYGYRNKNRLAACYEYL